MKVIKVGITGGIGSGKSVVARILRVLGYKVYDCDKSAAGILLSDMSVRAALVDLLGDDIYLHDGQLNKAKMSGMLFNSPSVRADVNAIVHPAVIADFIRWAEMHSADRLLFVESAILAESGLISAVDKSIMVSAPRPERRERVASRDNISVAQADERIASQMPDEDKCRLCDFVISNAVGDRLLPQICEVIGCLLQD